MAVMLPRAGRALATLGLVTVLAACSSTDEGDGGVRSGDDLAALVGCTGYDGDSDEIFVTEGGTCKLDGQDIAIAYFASTDARDSYVDAGTSFGALYLVGPNWTVEGKRATLETLRDEHGGEITG